VVQTRNDDDDGDGGDCIGSILGKLLRVLSSVREIFIETLNKNFTEFFNVRIFREILHYSLGLLVSI